MNLQKGLDIIAVSNTSSTPRIGKAQYYYVVQSLYYHGFVLDLLSE